MNTKHIVFGQVFAHTNTKESIDGRLGSPEVREAFYEREAKKLSPSIKERISEFLLLTYDVKNVKFTFSRKAGCDCPCSPGWSVSAKLPATSSGFLNVAEPSFGKRMGYLESLPKRSRLNFHVGDAGRIDVHAHRKEVRYETRFHRNGRNRPSSRSVDYTAEIIATIV